jgi:hypothetical protein
MPANMSRLAQVCGTSTRKSLNRERLGVTHAFQGMSVQELRLNGKNLGMGMDTHATTVGTRDKHGRYRTEKVFSKDTDVKYLLWQCLKTDPSWKPSKYARKAYREHEMLKGRDKSEGMLG